MSPLRVLSNFVCKWHPFEKGSEFIFYKIVDFNESHQEYMLQCINTSAIFYASLEDIVFDSDILHALHPVQACYTGIEYAFHLKKVDISFSHKKEQESNKNSVSRYGNYILNYQDRKGNLFFVNRKNKKSFLMDPRDIAFSEHLIEEFDAAQAFYIGVFAGLKLSDSYRISDINLNNKYPHLRLIK